MDQFEIYLNELKDWNNKFNLTSITTDEDIRLKHFDDSLSLSKAYDFSQVAPSLIDIGTGAGFPGIPLKIKFPNIKLTLVDSVKKKTEFLKHIADILQLRDVEVIWGRAEDIAKEKRETFDVATCRALADLRIAAELCLPFVKVGGVFIAMKAESVEEEIKNAQNAFSILGGSIEKTVGVNIGGMNRNLIVVKKATQSPEKYPRRAGMPEKRPL